MANGIPGFRSDGLAVGNTWSPVELGELAPPARAALVKHAGRFVRVHPADVHKLAAHGLELYVDDSGAERVRELELKPRDLAPGEKLEEGALPAGVTAEPIPAPTPEPTPAPPAPAPTAAPAARGRRG